MGGVVGGVYDTGAYGAGAYGGGYAVGECGGVFKCDDRGVVGERYWYVWVVRELNCACIATS